MACRRTAIEKICRTKLRLHLTRTPREQWRSGREGDFPENRINQIRSGLAVINHNDAGWSAKEKSPVSNSVRCGFLLCRRTACVRPIFRHIRTISSLRVRSHFSSVYNYIIYIHGGTGQPPLRGQPAILICTNCLTSYEIQTSTRSALRLGIGSHMAAIPLSYGPSCLLIELFNTTVLSIHGLLRASTALSINATQRRNSAALES